MLYPELPMGTEEYYLFISHNNRNIEPTDLSTLSGKKIGVNKNSIQRTFFEEWVKENSVEP
jgi:ABC-type amino acid transport substrate-binding protein